MNKLDKKGFSLIEILITIAIIVIVSVSTTVFMSTLLNAKEQKAVNALRSNIENLRTRSMSVSGNYYIEIANKEGTIYITSYKDGEELESEKLASGVNLSLFYTKEDSTTGTNLEVGDNIFLEFNKTTGAISGFYLNASPVISTTSINGESVKELSFNYERDISSVSYVNFNLKARKTKSLTLYLKTGMLQGG